MLLDHGHYYGLGMDALVTVTVCSWNTDVIMVWGMDALVIVCSWIMDVIMVWAWTL